LGGFASEVLVGVIRLFLLTLVAALSSERGVKGELDDELDSVKGIREVVRAGRVNREWAIENEVNLQEFE
jgi:hypothetical protein